jgi:hypothetical protein
MNELRGRCLSLESLFPHCSLVKKGEDDQDNLFVLESSPSRSRVHPSLPLYTCGTALKPSVGLGSHPGRD